MVRFIKLSLTLALIIAAVYFGYDKYRRYIENPWTRDGQVRTQVVQIAPRVTGMVTKIHVTDNQHVKKGDLLFEIDPSRYELKVKQARARLQRALEAAKGTKTEYERVKKIYEHDRGAVSQKDLVRNETAYFKSLADIDAAREALNAAKLNLSFTKVYAPVDGYVSNITFQVGTQATANRPILALVDEHSFWVFGFFKESAIKHIAVGDKAIVTLMAYPDTPLKGKVESIAWGISHKDGNPGENLLPRVNPVFQWIRLAQRIPVRIELTDVPENVKLRYGLTASVLILHENNVTKR
jgi:multidrug resistance efflux pump